MNPVKLVILLVLVLSSPQLVAAGGFRKLDSVLPPSLVLPDMSGASTKLDDYKGKVVLVNFWATWCPPCRREMPSMQRLQEKMAGQPFVVLGVDSAEPREDVMAFLEVVRVGFPILLDIDSTVTKRWKVYALPTSFIVDRTGRIRYSLSGPTEWDEGEALQLIESLLRER
jgi:thiol-disulfide isomerase/thioredoxin